MPPGLVRSSPSSLMYNIINLSPRWGGPRTLSKEGRILAGSQSLLNGDFSIAG